MYKVVLPGGGKPRFPEQCVCCLEASTVTRSIRLEESLKARDGFDSEYPVSMEIIGVPYCAEHGREFDAHAHRLRGARVRARLIGLGFAGAAALLLHALTEQWLYPLLGGLFAYVLAEKAAGALLGAADTALGIDGMIQARLEQDQQSRRTQPVIEAIVLRFRNPDYARLFSEANGRIGAADRVDRLEV